ncbi:MAG: large subunit ribosomal protein [Chloroflexota bacterium]|jgi:large subunit ribosomal protein L1|nr:large subunit ribosomal protein [Chloroflexota bacterium]
MARTDHQEEDMPHSRRYREAADKIDPDRDYAPTEAVALAKETSATKFDSTIEAHVRLGVDPRHADQMVRGTVVLPHGTGKKQRIVVFAQGEKQREARDAGADEVGGDDLAKRIQDGWLDFDVALATPDMMGVVGRLGKVLGPRGLMPNPKSNTVTFDLARAIKDVQAGRVEYRVDKTGVVHSVIGKASFSEDQLLDNFSALMESIVKAKPSTAKGVYVKSVFLAGTMSPSTRVDPAAAGKLTHA